MHRTRGRNPEQTRNNFAVFEVRLKKVYSTMNANAIGAGARKETTSPSTSHGTAGKYSLLALRTIRTAIACYIRVRSGKTPHAKLLVSRQQRRARALTKIEV